MHRADHAHSCCGAGFSRRELLAISAAGLAAAPSAGAWTGPAGAGRHPVVRLPLKVQPVLVYETYQRREQTSWRPWGGLLSDQDIEAEKNRIGRELEQMKSAADFPLEILPLATARTRDEAAAIAKGEYDAGLMYAASGPLEAYETMNVPGKRNVMFVRHRSGPVYLWYEIAHPRYLRKTVDEYGEPGMDSQDVVVDSHDDVLWRLRALAALKNTVGKRMVCVGGPSGWGKGGRQAPDITRNLWKFDLQTVSYDDLGKRIEAARGDEALVRRTREDADRYLKQRGVRLETDVEFVRNAFLLTEVFHDLMAEAKTDAMTINNCMSTIMPISKTTACMPLSLINDDGYMAFCESDFVVIPSGVLLRYISGKPVFLNDPTYPHHGVVTLAHCTAPRKMDGERLEPARILTHFESDFGAAPKVEMRKGQVVTNLIPDFGCKRWVGFEGEIVDSPFMAICRSQIDVRIKGSCERLAEEMRGFHWMTSYGSYLRETGYALKKLGVGWLNVSA
ncbi:MAG: hypothetical protein KIT09_20665 [Bryobacteraceae bacterium]|nr:hypothetical protein [Bryobacteraceae bacterium]